MNLTDVILIYSALSILIFAIFMWQSRKRIFSSSILLLDKDDFQGGGLSIFAIVAVVVGIASRLYNFGVFPEYLHQDEAMAFNQCVSLIGCGRDTWDISYPIVFKAWGGENQFPLLHYSASLTMIACGESIFSLRLTMLIFSLVGFASFIYICCCFKSKKLTLWCIIICSLSPWMIAQSRWALDCNTQVHVFVLALAFLFAAIKYNKRTRGHIFLCISSVLMGLTMYAYGLSLCIVPLFIIVSCIWLYKQAKIGYKYSILYLLIYSIVSLPFFLFIIINILHLRSIDLGIITIPSFEINRSSEFSFMKIINLFDFFQTVKHKIFIFVRMILGCWDNVANSIKYLGSHVIFASLSFLLSLVILTYTFIFRKNNLSSPLFLLVSIPIFTIIMASQIVLSSGRANIIHYFILFFAGYTMSQLFISKKQQIISFIVLIIGFFIFNFEYFSDENERIADGFRYELWKSVEESPKIPFNQKVIYLNYTENGIHIPIVIHRCYHILSNKNLHKGYQFPLSSIPVTSLLELKNDSVYVADVEFEKALDKINRGSHHKYTNNHYCILLPQPPLK